MGERWSEKPKVLGSKPRVTTSRTEVALHLELNHERLPTISTLCGRHRWLAPIILLALAFHLYWREEHYGVLEGHLKKLKGD